MRHLLYRASGVMAALGITLLGFAGAASASAGRPAPAPQAVVGGTIFTKFLAGYAGGDGTTHMDDIRGSVFLPSQASTGTPVPVDSLVVGLGHQQKVTAASTTDGIGWAWRSTLGVNPADGSRIAASGTDGAANQCPANEWTLAYGSGFSELPGHAIPPASLTPASQFNPVSGLFEPVCMVSGKTFIESSYNRHSRYLHFYEGAAWNQKDELASVYAGWLPMLIAGGGVDTSTGAAASDLNIGTTAGFTSVRIINYSRQNRGLSFYNLRKYEGTLNGGAPSVSNPLTLTTSAISGPFGNGTSAFTVSAP